MKYLLLVLLLCSCSPGGHFHVYEENDIFAGKKTDKFYTQGAKFAYSLPESKDGTVDSFAVGNNIYTPEHKHTAEYLPNERPYAGYSYAEGRRTKRSGSTETTFAVQAGTVGPASGGKFFQCGVHKLLGQGCPEGWANQLRNEPTVELLLQQRRKVYSVPILQEIKAEGIVDYGADVGNVRIAANTGFLVRLGVFGSDFGPVEITPRSEKLGDMAHLAGAPSKVSEYIFAGATGRAIARNIFLDGNTFEQSARVTKNPLVADLKVGFVVQYKEYRLAYTLTHITDEWKESSSAQNFGSLDISWGW